MGLSSEAFESVSGGEQADFFLGVLGFRLGAT
jgi:hypothetical protein